MPLNPSIILQAGQDVTPLLSPEDIQDKRMQREIGTYKLNALRQSSEDDMATRNALRSVSSLEDAPGALLKTGNLKAAQDAMKFQREQQRGLVDQRKAEVETSGKIAEMMGGPLKYLADNPSVDVADQVIRHLSERKLMTPEQAASAKQQLMADASPEGIKRFAMLGYSAAIKADDQMRNQATLQGHEVTRRGQDMQAETSRANNQATVGATLRGQDMGDVRQRELAQLTRESTAAGRVPSGYRQGANGSLEPVPGGPADPDAKGFKLTEDQGKATGWLVQAEQAFKNLEAVGFKDGKPTSAATPGFGDAVAAATWVPGAEAAGNWMRGANRQKFLQAAESAGEALLRAATGAGVNKDEAKQKARELTPQWGDSDATIAQKRAAYPLYLESLRIRAGPGAAPAGKIAGGAAAPKGGASGSLEDAKAPAGRTVVRIGTKPDGRKVAQYSDGTSGYVD